MSGWRQEKRQLDYTIFSLFLVLLLLLIVTSLGTCEGKNTGSEVVDALNSGEDAIHEHNERGRLKRDGASRVEDVVVAKGEKEAVGMRKDQNGEWRIVAGPSEEEAKRWAGERRKKKEAGGKGRRRGRRKKMRVTYRGKGFGTDVNKIHVTINGMRAPGVVLHSQSAISFEIPQNIWRDSRLLRHSVLRVSVGEKKKLGFLPLVAIMDAEDVREDYWKEGGGAVGEDGDNEKEREAKTEQGEEVVGINDRSEAVANSRVEVDEGSDLPIDSEQRSDNLKENKVSGTGDSREGRVSQNAEAGTQEETASSQSSSESKLNNFLAEQTLDKGKPVSESSEVGEEAFSHPSREAGDSSGIRDNAETASFDASKSEADWRTGVNDATKTFGDAVSLVMDKSRSNAYVTEPAADWSARASGRGGSRKGAPSSEETNDPGSKKIQDADAQPGERQRTLKEMAIENLTTTVENLLRPSEGKGNRLVVELLETAVELGDDKAMASLGALYLAGDVPGVPRNVQKAVEHLRMACDKGNGDGQALMGFLHATGLAKHHGVPQSTSKAITYWSFAARSGSVFARMALAHRHLNGLDITESCETASTMYERIASEVVDVFNRQLSRPPRLDNKHIPREIVPPSPKRLYYSDRKRLSSDFVPEKRGDSDEVLQFYRYTGTRNDPQVQVMIGILHYHGSHGVPQDHAKAREMFELAAKSGSMEAHAHLGIMDLREGDYVNAYSHFQTAQGGKNVLGTQGLAYCLLHGLGTKQDVKLAAKYFELCAKANSGDAIYNFGILRQLGIGIPQSSEQALVLFRAAANEGHVLARYLVGTMYLHGSEHSEKDCSVAAHLLKRVSEQGTWPTIISKALRAYEQKDYSTSLYRYLQAAHAGIELAQYNAAYMYEKGLVGNAWSSPTQMDSERKEEVQNAMSLYEMSALQGNAQSMVHVGDLAYTELKDHSAAGDAYMRAVKLKNAEAMFNMGWMHWHGLGVKKDVFMAKRYFDRAVEANQIARLPSLLATRALLIYMIYMEHVGDLNRLWETVRKLSVWAYSMELLLVTALLGLLAVIINVRQQRLMQANEERDRGAEAVLRAEEQEQAQVNATGNGGTR